MAKREASPERYQELTHSRPNPFVNYDMSDSEKKQYKKWLEEQNAESILNAIAMLLESGYAVSIKHDDYNDCEAAYLTCSKEGNPNKALILSGRGRSVGTAVCNAVFKHTVLFDAQWPEAASRRKSTDED
jgi:hypothetical protein